MLKKIVCLIVSIIAIALIIWFWDFIKDLFSEIAFWYFTDSENGKGELLKIFLAVLGGIGALVGLYLSYRRVIILDSSIKHQDKTIANNTLQLELNRKTQINESFKIAVEHLASEKSVIILGGIIESHNIAVEDPKRYANVIGNILINLLINYSKKPKESNEGFNIIENRVSICQNLINVLFKNGGHNLYKFENQLIEDCDFSLLDLNDCYFNGIEFYSIYFPTVIQNCQFHDVRISTCKFIDSQFKHIYFTDSEFKHCYFKFSMFNNVVFKKSFICFSNIYKCVVESTKIDTCKFILVKIVSSNITKLEASNCYHITMMDFVGNSFDEISLINNVLSDNRFYCNGFNITSNSRNSYEDCNIYGLFDVNNSMFDSDTNGWIDKKLDVENSNYEILKMNSEKVRNCTISKFTKRELDIAKYIISELEKKATN